MLACRARALTPSTWLALALCVFPVRITTVAGCVWVCFAAVEPHARAAASSEWATGSTRPPSGRLGTAARPGTGSIAGAEVQVTDRPVTQQGMMGMRPASAGPGRQIQDATYYSGLLRSKISQLTAEITKLKADIDQFNKDNSTYIAVRVVGRGEKHRLYQLFLELPTPCSCARESAVCRDSRVMARCPRIGMCITRVFFVRFPSVPCTASVVSSRARFR